jgi:hypothetical protein
VKAKTEVGPPGLSAFRTVRAAKEMRMMAATTRDPAVQYQAQARLLIALRLNEALFIGDMV